MKGNRTHIVSLCCCRDTEEKFMAVKDAQTVLRLMHGFSPEAEAVLVDQEGIGSLPALPSKTLLFLLEVPKELRGKGRDLNRMDLDAHGAGETEAIGNMGDEGNTGNSPFSQKWISRAEYIFTTPFGYEAILRHIAHLLGEENAEPSRERLERQITESLRILQIHPRLLGHTYLLEGVVYLFSQSHPRSSRLLQTIYSHIAERHHTSPVMVDRAIRHGIEVCWKKAEHSRLKSLLGYDPHDLLGMPTNGEFLYALYEHLRSLLTPSYGKTAFLRQLRLLSGRNAFFLPE